MDLELKRIVHQTSRYIFSARPMKRNVLALTSSVVLSTRWINHRMKGHAQVYKASSYMFNLTIDMLEWNNVGFASQVL